MCLFSLPSDGDANVPKHFFPTCGQNDVNSSPWSLPTSCFPDIDKPYFIRRKLLFAELTQVTHTMHIYGRNTLGLTWESLGNMKF